MSLTLCTDLDGVDGLEGIHDHAVFLHLTFIHLHVTVFRDKQPVLTVLSVQVCQVDVALYNAVNLYKT